MKISPVNRRDIPIELNFSHIYRDRKYQDILFPGVMCLTALNLHVVNVLS